jgi:hypothetical protein
MSDNDIIGQVEAEETDLATHTRLCHMRYLQIINKFDNVDAKFDKLETLILEIKTGVDNMKMSTHKDYLNISLYIIGLLITVVGFLVVRYIL